MKATNRIIDSVWTLTYLVLDDITIQILDYTREDKDGYELENRIPTFNIYEDHNRNIIFVKLIFNGVSKWMKVHNPQEIFSYHKGNTNDL